MSEEWGTPISKEKIIDRRNRLIEYQKTQGMRFTVGYQIIDENILDINYMIYEIERLNNIIKRLEEFIEKEIELYTVELTEENKNILGYTAPIRGVYKEIYNVLQELKGSDKE